MQILVIDDELVSRKKMQVILKRVSGCGATLLVNNGKEGLQLARESLPDLILLDVVMPDMDGYQVIQALKNEDTTKDIPVIFISGLDSSEEEGNGLLLGAVDYITKPFYPPIVKARVSNHLNYLRQRKLLESQANLDGLTEISNRRRYDGRLTEEWYRALRSHCPLSIAMIDIDYFKPFNDHYGHACGDDVLKKVAKAIAGEMKRASDFCARYGGEEFVLLLPDTDRDGAKKLAEQVRLAVEQLDIRHEFSNGRNRVTISVGGTTVIPEKKRLPADFLKKADAMLYQAKEGGRNQVEWE